MHAPAAVALTIRIDDTESVSALLWAPKEARACYVFAHGAGAGMNHPFMAAVAEGLAERAVATLRYQFPSMERGSKRPDSPKVAQSAVRAAVAEAGRRLADVPLFAGGKSFGGRMTSQAQAQSPLDGVRGLAFIGFPLHPAGKPALDRAAHLREIACPMLFLQGTRDELAETALLRYALEPLGSRVSLKLIEGADHSFHVRASSGTNDGQVRAEMLDVLVAWFANHREGGPALGEYPGMLTVLK